jgi:predicted acylesterase/phospholipase RssA
MTYKYKVGLAVFAGGNHIFYIMGLLNSLLSKGLTFDVLSTYSAGSAIVGDILNDSLDKPFLYFKKLLKINKKNIYLENIFNNKEIFPHNRMYTDVIEHILLPQLIQNSDKVVRVISTRINSSFPRTKAFLSMLSLLAYSKTKKTIGEDLLRIVKRLFKLESVIFTNQDFSSYERSLNIILGSSTIYPFIKLHSVDGKFYIDGKHGMVSPIDVLSDCEHVLSLHAHGSWPTLRPNLVQHFPPQKVKVSPLDYTDAKGIEIAYQRGISDGHSLALNLEGSIFLQ